MLNIKSEIRNEAKEIKKEVLHKTSGYFLTALGLVAALAWNDAIKLLIEYLFPLEKNTILIKFVYAVLITIIVVIVSVFLTKMLSEEKVEK